MNLFVILFFFKLSSSEDDTYDNTRYITIHICNDDSSDNKKMISKFEYFVWSRATCIPYMSMKDVITMGILRQTNQPLHNADKTSYSHTGLNV